MNINRTIRHKMLMKHYIKNQKRWDNYDNYGRTNSQKVLKESLKTKVTIYFNGDLCEKNIVVSERTKKASRKVQKWRSYRV